MRCYICSSEITSKNRSCEHVFLNAIGGRLKSRNLICKSCNDRFGEEIDNSLANQLSFFSTLLNVKRDRGTPQPVLAVTHSGRRLLVKPSGGMSLSKPEIPSQGADGGINGEIKARTIREAKQILLGLAKKNPRIDVEKSLKNARNESEYLYEGAVFRLDFGGQSAFRALCKMATNFYMLQGGDRSNIEGVLPFIQYGTGNNPGNFYYPEHQTIIPKKTNEVVHAIILVGDPSQRILCSYIELFSALHFVVILNNTYEGDVVNSSYIFDILEGKQIARESHMVIDRTELEHVIHGQPNYVPKLEAEIAKLTPVIQAKQQREYMENLIRQSLDELNRKYPTGTLMTEEIARQATGDLMKRLSPYLSHLVRINQQKSINVDIPYTPSGKPSIRQDGNH